MQQGRRTNDRRRRVLYSAQQAENGPTSAASRRAAEKLREARCPQMAYGSRVQQRIRGRWFSLVPIRLRSILLVSFIISLLATILCVAHYAAVTWTPISTRPMIARPLRLDRADSFGRWCMVAMLTVTAGIALMTYQLRRYRNDDFGGHYRLWRVVIVFSVLASVNALASLVDWSGAIIDAGFGKRVALAGSDWVRLVVTFGGAVLALRMVAELWHCRTALILMLTSCILFVIPEAVQWNILKTESAEYWTLATTAPLLGCTTLLIAMLTYLRLLYREVKQVEDTSITDRLQQFRQRLFQSEETGDEESATPDDRISTEPKTKQRWWQQRQSDDKASSKTEQERPKPQTNQGNSGKRDLTKKQKKVGVSQTADEEVMDQTPEAKPPKVKRRWFGLRAPKASASETSTESGMKASSESEQKAKKSGNKRTRASSRSKSASSSQTKPLEIFENESDKTDKTTARKGLMGWRRNKEAKQSEAEERADSSRPQSQEQRAAAGIKPTSPQPQNDTEDESMESDEIDWSSMNKAQRRRLRKQLKRQNKAA